MTSSPEFIFSKTFFKGVDEGLSLSLSKNNIGNIRAKREKFFYICRTLLKNIFTRRVLNFIILHICPISSFRSSRWFFILKKLNTSVCFKLLRELYEPDSESIGI